MLSREGQEVKRYYITGTLSVTCYTEVEANSPEEALEIARERRVAGLCNNPFDGDSSESWNFDSDGEPFELQIDDVNDI
jgi:hypothetical protein